MSDIQPQTTAHGSPNVASAPSPARSNRSVLFLLGTLTVLAIYGAGFPAMNAPWLPGDETIFIIDNPDVTGGRPTPAPFWQRIGRVFTKVHEDLYQPVPILTYVLEAAAWGNQPYYFRQTDVLLHALNALLLWQILRKLLGRAVQAANPTTSEQAFLIDLLAWGLATLWALHPLQTGTYAADMGRTHLLSAGFALLSLWLHLNALPSRHGYFIGALAVLILAMLCKPIPGWIGLVFVLEAALLGWRAALRSPRVYAVGIVCIGFAVLTYWTSRQSGMIEDAAQGLFGDPFCRSALAVWIYFRDLLVPLWLAVWHLPDPHTTWTNPRVWAGVLLTLASLGHAAWAWRRTETRLITVGWVWFWVLLLPVIGLIGAREAAAVDRYLYQPLMGFMLVVGIVITHKLATLTLNPKSKIQNPKYLLVGLPAALGFAFLLWDLPHVKVARSPIQRAKRVAELNPGDPRALEMLANNGYDFARNHSLPDTDFPPDAPANSQERRAFQFQYFNQIFIETLNKAASAKNLETYFPRVSDRAPFHRRLSYRFRLAGDFQRALEQAQISRGLQPDSPYAWNTLAAAYQALRRWNDALDAYRQYETRLPDESQPPSFYERALRFIEIGNLLNHQFDQPAEAYRKYAAAMDLLQRPGLDRALQSDIEAARMTARIGMALCEVRIGQGLRGFQIIEDILKDAPTNVEALLVLGEYHLRSHHWAEAGTAYGTILELAYDTGGAVRHDQLYKALRGYHELCTQTGQWAPAVEAWKEAVQHDPNNRAYWSFWVWALACAGDPQLSEKIDALFALDPNNPFGCFAKMLAALREQKLEEAIHWAKTAATGEPIPDARPAERAVTTLRLLRERQQLPPEALIVEAALRVQLNQPEEARRQLQSFLEQFPNAPASAAAKTLLDELPDKLEKPERP